MKLKRLIARKILNRQRFRRQQGNPWVKLREGWRYPKGIDSKMRRKRKDRGPLPDPGYGAPRAIRGLHPSGLEEVLVRNPSELEGLNPEKHLVRIYHGVGKRKRLEILKKAQELGLKVANPGVSG